MDIFVSSPFDDDFNTVFGVIEEVARGRGLKAYHVGQDHLGKPLAEEITRGIRESRVVIADITGNNANVFNEIGQAQILGKPLILISRDEPTKASFNLRGLRILHYTLPDCVKLRQVLNDALVEATSVEVLRSMLVPASLGRPTRDSWFMIVTSPLSFWRAMRRYGGFTDIRRTFADYVGVRGILQSFGLLYGFDALPDVINPDDFIDDVIKRPMNMYCIASPKANRWTGKLLKELGKRWDPLLEFRPDDNSPDLMNVCVSLYCNNNELPADWSQNDKADRSERDFGIIVRAPNPYFDDGKYMVTILAGRASLGTEAACRALIDPEKTEDIRKRLAAIGIDLENHKQPFRALVSIRREILPDKSWGKTIYDSLTVLDVQPFARKS